MTSLVAMSAATGRHLAEVGFLLLAIAGIWLAASQLPQMRWRAFRLVVAGFATTAGAVLLIVAVHWGHFN